MDRTFTANGTIAIVGHANAPWRETFVCFIVLMSVAAFYPLFQDPGFIFRDTAISAVGRVTESAANRSNPLYILFWMIAFAGAAWLSLKSAIERGIEKRLLLLLLFAAYVAASTLWSVSPEASLTPAVMLGFNVLIAWALAYVVETTTFLKLLARTNLALAALSLALLAFNPAAALYEPDRPGLIISGQLSGIYADKAILATFAVISLLIVTFLPGTIPGRWNKIAAQLVLIITVLFTNSASAIAGAAAAFGVLILARALPSFASLILLAALVAVAIVAGILPFTGAGDIAELMGRSPDLTGRGEFWPLAPGLIGEEPILGYGYMAFFTDGANSLAWRVWNIESYFWTPNFHNTWLDVLIGLGAVGGIAYALMLMAAISIVANPTLHRRTADVLGATLLILILNSATEFSFLYHNRLATILLFYCVIVSARVLQRPRAI